MLIMVCEKGSYMITHCIINFGHQTIYQNYGETAKAKTIEKARVRVAHIAVKFKATGAKARATVRIRAKQSQTELEQPSK
jgi:hypothetical protein